MENVGNVRVRYAPSPTGPQHLGGIRTALFNYLFAKKNGGTFVFRSEDTDQSRFVPGAEDYITDSLRWAGITVDEGLNVGGPYGPYRQSERKELYREYAMQLITSGHAYYAFDTSEDLEAMRTRMTAQGNPSPAYDHITRQYMQNSLALPKDEVEKRLAAGDPYVIRIMMPRNEEVKFNDIVRGWVVFNTNQLDDKVLFKSDGMPTYHLANVVDDHLMHITHVMLYRAFGWEDTMPQFAHLPLVLKPEGNGKLSKRDGDRLGFPIYTLDWENPLTGEKISGLAERGFLPEAYTNFLALLGWHPGGDTEVMDPDALLEAFSLERVGKSGARFDPEKAKWINQQHLKMKSDKELAALLEPVLTRMGITSDAEYVERVCGLMKERAVFVPDLYEQGKYFFSDTFDYDSKTIAKKWKKDRANLFVNLTERINLLQVCKSAELEQLVHAFMEEHELKMGDVMPMLRIALTGTLQGPPVYYVMEVLGKEKSVTRLQNGWKVFNQII